MKRLLQTPWFEILGLALISGLTYLPHIAELTYYKDDWYFLYNALVRGPEALIQVALHTRPIRGPLYALYYSLYGLNPLPYHITMWITRLAGGIAAWWLFRLLWPQQRRATFLLAVLFVLYPGFHWWVAGFEFQPYVLSVGLQALSIAFTIKAISTPGISKRIGWMLASLLSGLAYLALVEYAIGMEALRLICVFIYLKHQSKELKFLPLFWQSLRTSAFYFLIPLLFLIWYVFLFDNWRSAQDAGTQFSVLFSSPLTLLWRSVDVFRSVLNASVLAWAVPFYQNFYDNRLTDLMLGFGFTAVVLIIFLQADSFLRKQVSEEDEVPPAASDWRMEWLWAGLLGTLGGILPVVLANRVVTLERITQYTLPASLAAVLLAGGLIYLLTSRFVRNAVICAVVGLAVLTHHGLAAQAVTEERIISDFWWQVSWRAPDIQPGTTLAVLYPGINYAEGNDVVWGPANFIYQPGRQTETPVLVPIAGSRMEADSMLDIIRGSRDYQQVDVVIKNVTINYDYGNLLLISQPSVNACVHVLDPRWPDISVNDPALVHASYQNSKIANINPEGNSPTPPKEAFGEELPHDWCYYYQKADLARQQGNWEEVVHLAEQALKLGLHPNDQIEWMPFVQAYAMINDLQRVKELSRRINTESFYKQQACDNFETMSQLGLTLSTEMQAQVQELFCNRP